MSDQPAHFAHVNFRHRGTQRRIKLFLEGIDRTQVYTLKQIRKLTGQFNKPGIGMTLRKYCFLMLPTPAARKVGGTYEFRPNEASIAELQRLLDEHTYAPPGSRTPRP